MAKGYHRRRRTINRLGLFIFAFILGYLVVTISYIFLFILRNKHIVEKLLIKYQRRQTQVLRLKSNYMYEDFIQWNRTLCSQRSDQRGAHQKVISISIYASESLPDNPMYSWETSVLKFLKPLADEIKVLLPEWILRVYIDFTGSTKFQAKSLSHFSNVDVCDMKDIPMFGSSLRSFLPGRMWRFLPIFDPYVDYFLSRDLDSPITAREIETIDMWLSREQEKQFFYIARDHNQHNAVILAGLWGAATRHARHELFTIFEPMLIPSIAQLYKNKGDQQFLSNHIWNFVKHNALIFDSYFCQTLTGQPFLSQRPPGDCFLGCIRPCCSHEIKPNFNVTLIPCPIECRPKEHLDWIYC